MKADALVRAMMRASLLPSSKFAEKNGEVVGDSALPFVVYIRYIRPLKIRPVKIRRSLKKHKSISRKRVYRNQPTKAE